MFRSRALSLRSQYLPSLLGPRVNSFPSGRISATLSLSPSSSLLSGASSHAPSTPTAPISTASPPKEGKGHPKRTTIEGHPWRVAPDPDAPAPKSDIPIPREPITVEKLRAKLAAFEQNLPATSKDNDLGTSLPHLRLSLPFL